jgi:hypothetical protein
MAESTRRAKPKAPRLNVVITAEDWATAQRSKSGGCLIADAIKRQHPEFSRVEVDMTTIRFSDRAAGLRYVYLTPDEGQHILINYDQGWSQPFEAVPLKKAVQIHSLRPTSKTTRRGQTRAARLEQLEQLEAAGTASAHDLHALARMRATDAAPDQPRAYGAPTVDERGTVIGGPPTPQLRKIVNPNLLRGTDRHFGAKLADPGIAFREAVEQATTELMAVKDAEIAALRAELEAAGG